MGVVLPQILQPDAILGVINRLKLVNTTCQDFLGLRGAAVTDAFPIRRGSYDIFDSTRRVAGGRMPETSHAIVKKNPVGSVNVTIPRTADSMYVSAEYLDNLRRIGGPAGQNDVLGEDYILRQIGTLGQTVNNLKEFQAAALMRGAYYYQQSGDDIINSFTSSGAMHTVDFQVPSGNKTKLDMLGGGDILATSWDNAAAPIITDLLQINAAFQQLTGRGLRRVALTSVGWGYVVANTQVQAQAGTVNRVFEFINRNEEDESFTAKLHAIPWITWYITDEVLEIGGTATKLIEDDHASFVTDLGDDVIGRAAYYEPFSRWTGDPVEKRGEEYYWAKPVDNPSGHYLNVLYNAMPILKIPKSLAYGLIKY